MKTMKFSLLAIVGLGIMATSCRKEGCTDVDAFNYNEEAKKDDQSCTYDNQVTLKFTQSFDDQNVTSADFDDIKYTNAKGTELSIRRLRYSISDIRFYKADGDSVVVEMAHLIDLEDATTLSVVVNEKVDPVAYTGFGFVYGLTPERNTPDQHKEWNASTGWAWPFPAGGGYHQMQLDGDFIDSTGATDGFNFHNGSLTKDGDNPTQIAVPNYVMVKFNQAIDMTTDRSIEIGMQIDQWFENPNLWDLDLLNTALMGNKAAQLLISENATNVFELVEVE